MLICWSKQERIRRMRSASSAARSNSPGSTTSSVTAKALAAIRLRARPARRRRHAESREVHPRESDPRRTGPARKGLSVRRVVRVHARRDPRGNDVRLKPDATGTPRRPAEADATTAPIARFQTNTELASGRRARLLNSATAASSAAASRPRRALSRLPMMFRTHAVNPGDPCQWTSGCTDSSMPVNPASWKGPGQLVADDAVAAKRHLISLKQIPRAIEGVYGGSKRISVMSFSQTATRPPGPHHAPHLPQHGVRPRDVLEQVARVDEVEAMPGASSACASPC